MMIIFLYQDSCYVEHFVITGRVFSDRRRWQFSLNLEFYYNFVIGTDTRVLWPTQIYFNPSMDKWLHAFKVNKDTTYPSSNVKVAALEVWKLKYNVIPHFTGHVATFMLGLTLIQLSKRKPINKYFYSFMSR